MELGDPTREAMLTVLRTSRLMPLDSASGEHGVLVAGRHPAVVIFGRGFLRVHPWKLDRNEGVRSSARFRSLAAGPDGIVCIGDKVCVCAFWRHVTSLFGRADLMRGFV